MSDKAYLIILCLTAFYGTMLSRDTLDDLKWIMLVAILWPLFLPIVIATHIKRIYRKRKHL